MLVFVFQPQKFPYLSSLGELEGGPPKPLENDIKLGQELFTRSYLSSVLIQKNFEEFLGLFEDNQKQIE